MLPIKSEYYDSFVGNSLTNSLDKSSLNYKIMYEDLEELPDYSWLVEAMYNNLDAIKYHNSYMEENLMDGVFVPDEEQLNILVEKGDIKALIYFYTFDCVSIKESILKKYIETQPEIYGYFTKQTKLINGIEMGMLINHGSYGKVYHLNEDYNMVAKVFKSQSFFAEKVGLTSPVIREIATLKALIGVYNIVQLQSIHFDYDDYVKDESPPIIIIPYYENTLTNTFVKSEDIPWIVFQILNGLAGMLNRGIMHRDIKPDNILINPDTMELVLADFGSSKLTNGEFINMPGIKSINRRNTSEIQTPRYRSPEVLKRLTIKNDITLYDDKLDIWSVGLIMRELYGGVPINEYEAQDQLIEYKNIKLPNIERTAIEVLKSMLQIDHLKRISIWEVMNMYYFRNFEPSEPQWSLPERFMHYNTVTIFTSEIASIRIKGIEHIKLFDKCFRSNMKFEAISLWDVYLSKNVDTVSDVDVGYAYFLTSQLYSTCPIEYRDMKNLCSDFNLGKFSSGKLHDFIYTLDFDLWTTGDKILSCI